MYLFFVFFHANSNISLDFSNKRRAHSCKAEKLFANEVVARPHFINNKRLALRYTCFIITVAYMQYDKKTERNDKKVFRIFNNRR